MNSAQAREILARHFGVEDKNNGAFVGRFQHLQKLGFPDGTNTGRGRAADYSDFAVAQLAAALHLNFAGMMPERVIELLRGQKGAVIRALETGEPCILLATGPYQNASPVELKFHLPRLTAEPPAA